jgi:hypothetical protein
MSLLCHAVDRVLHGESRCAGRHVWHWRNELTIDFVTIGNPGNPPIRGRSQSGGRGRYEYRIAKYEISRDMVSKASAGNLGLPWTRWIS